MMPETPLLGRKVLVTRDRTQAEALCRDLTARGARPLLCPLIAFAEPDDWRPVDRTIAALDSYHGIFFTSANAVRFFLGRMRRAGRQAEDLRALECFAVGPATAAVLAAEGIEVQDLPERQQAEGLVDLLGDRPLHGRRYLLPRARKAREILPRFLRERGAQADVVVVYETRTAEESRERLREILETDRVDYLTFTSGSTVRSFETLAPPHSAASARRGIPAACIGEVTAAAARSAGFRQVLVAHPSTASGLVAALVEHAIARAG